MLPDKGAYNVYDDVICYKTPPPNLIFFRLSLGPNGQILRPPIFPAIRYV